VNEGTEDTGLKKGERKHLFCAATIRTLDTNQFYNAHDDAIDIGYNSISSFHT
jgi:hypothetical protein